IIVVDDGSTDGLSQIVTTLFSSRTHCHLIRFEHNRGLSAARNAGWRAACGAIVLYIDDDAVPDPDWIEQMAQTYTLTTAGVGGLMRPYYSGLFSQYEMGLHVLTYGFNSERLDGGGGNNMSFRRSVLAD